MLSRLAPNFRKLIVLAFASILLVLATSVASAAYGCACLGSNVTGTKTVSGTFEVGGTVTYTIVLTNSAYDTQDDNPGDEFVDVLPSDLSLVSASATTGTAVANIGTNTVSWNGSVLSEGGTVTITITATINAGTEGMIISNQATINYDTDGNGTNDDSHLTDDPTALGKSDATSFTVAAAPESTPEPMPEVVATQPPPPETPLCENHNFDENGVVRSSVADALGYAVNCRVLYQNGAPTDWLGGDLYSAGSIGIPGIVELGVQTAVDIFSPPGRNIFEGGAVFCLRGEGTLIWIAASGQPRHAEIIGSYTVPEFEGFTCATLFEPGTLVLVNQQPA